MRRAEMHLPELSQEKRLLISVGETVTDFHDIRQSMKGARHARHLQGPEANEERRIIGVNETNSQLQPLSETELGGSSASTKPTASCSPCLKPN